MNRISGAVVAKCSDLLQPAD